LGGHGVKLKDLGEKWIGAKAVITLGKGTLDTTNAKISPRQNQAFTGIVTSVQLVKNAGDVTAIQISGASPTILLNAGKTTRTFTEKSLSSIVGNVLSPLSGLKNSVSPTFADSIPYLTQYDEENYDFLKRLAETYGEWLYYDGSALIFGKNARAPAPAVSLMHGVNLFRMGYRLSTTALNFKAHYYDYETDAVYESPASGERVDALQDFAGLALNKSEELFSDELIALRFQGHHNTTTLKQRVKFSKSGRSNHLAVMSGQTSELTLTVGGLITVKDEVFVNGQKQETIDYGTLLVTQLTHHAETNGRYYNTFEAIPQDTPFPPVHYQAAAPLATPQPAVVVDVNDDQRMGRVKVQFSWQQAKDETTPWVRVAQPMSNADKGVFFLPEKDDVVFVDFELGNPDLPFVRGSMYHGQAKPGGLFKQDNLVKGIITRGGNHILIDDTDGGEKIHIYNKDKENEIELSLSGEAHINVKTKGTLSLEAEKIKLKAATFEMKVDDTWKVESGKTEISNVQGMTVDTQSLEVSAQSEMTLKGMNVTVEAQAKAAVKGSAQLALEASGQATLKGAVVMIN
jgi:uncharacterized protein involved in type VI secretion and phage assembly